MSLFAYHVALFRCVRGRDAFEAAAERLRHSLQGKLPGASLEYGRNNNAEGLDHGYTHAVVMCGEKDSMGDFVKVMSDGMGETVAAQPPLVASFTARQVPPTPTGISIRHLVIWRFREDTPQDALQGAVEGYQRLPEIMPEYFEHLTTSTHDGPPPDPGSCEHFRLSVRTVVLYSTFVSAHEQEGFVADERRKSFKANYVAPHLDSGGCLVFDFIPGAS